MYLEISSRQTGKTTRLIDKAQEFLSLDAKNKCIFIVYREQIGEMLKKKLLPGFKSRVNFISISGGTSYLRGHGTETMILIDEFDYLEKQRINEVVRHIVDFDNLAVATTLCKSKTLREYVDYVKSDGNVIDYYFWRFMEETDFQYLVSYETITHNSNEGIKFNVMKKELNLDIMEGYNYEKYRT